MLEDAFDQLAAARHTEDFGNGQGVYS